jgi:formyltetrahydrofolate deformylase
MPEGANIPSRSGVVRRIRIGAHCSVDRKKAVMQMAVTQTHVIPAAEPTQRAILTISCPDRTGIVAAVSGFLADKDLFITESSHFGDLATGRFFMRTMFDKAGGLALDALRADFAAIANRFGMEWRIDDASRRARILIMVSRFDHCLNDLLYRYRTGSLVVEIPAIVSNHPDLAPLAEWHGIPFHHLPVTPETRAAQEAKLLSLVNGLEIDLVVLARYMQVLSEELSQQLLGRCINIHHSFLPSFKGARPYQQAHARGIKLIGATAHYVTTDLDEGPIIEQSVERVDHAMTAEDFIAIGRDIESLALSRAVRWHIEHRILLNGNKTVVFK